MKMNKFFNSKFKQELQVHNYLPMIVDPVSKLNKKSYSKLIIDNRVYIDYENEEDLHHVDLLNFNKPFRFIYKVNK